MPCHRSYVEPYVDPHLSILLSIQNLLRSRAPDGLAELSMGSADILRSRSLGSGRASSGQAMYLDKIYESNHRFLRLANL